MRKRLGWGSDLVLVSVGRLGPEKNWPLVFEAAAQAMREIPRLRLALAGNGPERDRLEALSSQLGIRGQVEFLGELPFNQIPSFLSAGDAFIFASTAETQGLVTMEAMAAGLPIVAVDGTGTRDVVQSGVQGFLTEKDSSSLGKAVVRLFESSDGLAKMREAVLIKARSFDIYTHAMEMLEVYERAIEKQKAGETVQVRRKRSIFSRST
jgi:glycosyltransferase involved in cell wall biosynthesis